MEMGSNPNTLPGVSIVAVLYFARHGFVHRLLFYTSRGLVSRVGYSDLKGQIFITTGQRPAGRSILYNPAWKAGL
jgi:hypothetical protein